MHPLASLALPANCRPCKWCAAYGNNSATYLCRAWHCRPMDVLLSEVLFIRGAVGLVDSCLYGLACLALPANGCPLHLCAVCARLLNLRCPAWPCRPMDAFALYTLFMLFILSLPQGFPQIYPSQSSLTLWAPVIHPRNTPDSHQGHARITPESHQNHTRAIPEPHQSHTRVTPESHPSHTRHTRVTP